MLGKLKHLISLKNVYIFALDKEKEEILKVSRSLRFLFLSFFLSFPQLYSPVLAVVFLQHINKQNKFHSLSFGVLFYNHIF